jgi:hypothetical protein
MAVTKNGPAIIDESPVFFGICRRCMNIINKFASQRANDCTVEKIPKA